MSGERYVGERSALWHFLSELRPLVVEALGEDALLHHHIDRALKTSDLEMLRQARHMFHLHPDDLKRRLMRGIFENTAPGSELPKMPTDSMRDTSDGKAERDRAVIRFDALPTTREKDVALSVELDHDRAGKAPVSVMIEPGTLPRGAAEALRQIADWIEHDRRILSRQHWTAAKSGDDAKTDETVDQI